MFFAYQHQQLADERSADAVQDPRDFGNAYRVDRHCIEVFNYELLDSRGAYAEKPCRFEVHARNICAHG